MIRPVARLAVVVVALATAIWLLPASVAIARWSSTGPTRVAFLAPLSSFWIALAAVTAAVGAVAFAFKQSGRTVDDFARIAAPLSLLLLWLVPFLPWLADRAPALLVFAGPARWAVAAAAVGGVAASSWRWRVPAVHIRPSVAFLIAFLVYAVAAVRFARDVGPGGDQPHYLVIAHSLLVDHDLDIANNHERGDYAAFFGGTLRPDFLRRGRHGEIYSIHAPGLPALVLPAYAIGGATGAMLFIAFLAALTSVAILELAGRVAPPNAALVTWAGVCFSIPFVPHAWLIYPELPGALIVAWVALWLWEPLESRGRVALVGVMLAALPWLHTKFVVLLAALTAAAALRCWPRARLLIALLSPIAVSMSLWLLSFYWMYGVFDPQAPYGSAAQTMNLAQNIPRGALGLLFDQKFGLLSYSALFVLAVPGAWMLLRDHRFRLRSLALLIAAAAFFLATTRFYMWWGGSSAPARFLVPILPLLVPFVAAAVARLDGPSGRALVVSSVCLALCLSAVAIGSAGERLVYSDPHGLASLVGALQGPAPLDRLLPAFTEENWSTPLAQLLRWLAALAASCAVAAALLRAGLVRSSFWIGCTAAITLVAAGGVVTARPAASIRSAAASSGQLALLHAYDPSRLHATDASRGARLTDGDVRAMMAFDMPLPGGSGLQAAAPIDLPEGRYEARVWFDGALERPGNLQLVSAGEVVIATSGVPLTSPATFVFDLPVTALVSVRATDPASSAAARRLQISAIAVTPRSARLVDGTSAIETLGDGAVRGLLAYADDQSYPEHGVYLDTRHDAVARGRRQRKRGRYPAGAARGPDRRGSGPGGRHEGLDAGFEAERNKRNYG